MPFVDQSTPDPEAGGALDRQKLLDAGTPTPVVQQWEQDQRQKMIDANVPVDVMDKYWGDHAPDTTKLQQVTQGALEAAPHLADSPMDYLTLGFTHGTTAAILGKGTTNIERPEDPGLMNTVLEGVGATADPVGLGLTGGGMVAGSILGSALGPLGTLAGGALGTYVGATISAATREGVIDAYNSKGGPFTWDQAVAEVSNIIHDSATDPGVLGNTVGSLAGPVVGKVVAPFAGKVLGSLAGAMTWGLTATEVSSQVSGAKVSADDFITAAILSLGTDAAGHFLAGRKVAEGTAAERFEPTPAGKDAVQNIQDIYQRTGLTPEEITHLAQTDGQIAHEIAQGRTPGGDQLTPALDAYAAGLRRPTTKDFEPNPPSPYEPLKEEPAEAPAPDAPPAPGKMLPEQVTPGTLTTVRALEGSNDNAVSPAGAIGRYQIMPNTARQYGFDPALLTDPAYNERAAKTILADLSNQFKGNLADMLVAYNAGPGRARAWIRGGREFGSLPMETQKYLLHAERMGSIDEGFTTQVQTQRLAEQGDVYSAPARDVPLGEDIPPAPPREPPSPPPEGAPRPEEPEPTTFETASRDADKLWGAPVEKPGFNAGKLLRGFQFALTNAKEIDKRIGLPKGEAGVEDNLRQSYGAEARLDHVYTNGRIFLTINPDGTFNWNAEKDGPSFTKAYKAVKDQGGDIKGFRNYQLASRTLELAQRGIKTALPVDKANAIVREPGQFDKYGEAMRILHESKDGVIDLWHAAGMLSAERAQAVKDAGQSHVVLRKVVEGKDYRPLNPGGAFGEVRQGLKKIEGGEDRIYVPPEQADLDNANFLITQAGKNAGLLGVIDTLRSMAQATNDYQGPDLKLVKVSKNARIKEVEDALSAAKDENGEDLTPGDRAALTPALTAKEVLASTEDSRNKVGGYDFAVWRDGNLEVWRTTDQQLAELLSTHWYTPGGDPINSVLRTFARIQRSGIASTLDFPLRVLGHATRGAAAFAEGGSWNPFFGNMIHGGIAAVWGDKVGGFYKDAFDRYLANGGGNVAMGDLDSNLVRLQPERLFQGDAKTSAYGTVINAVNLPIEALRAIQHHAETLSRVGLMIKAQQQGASPLHAAMLARKGYLDHAEPMVSTFLNRWSQAVPFMKVGFQEWQQVTQAFKNRPVETAARAFLVFSLPTIINTVLNRAVFDPQLPPDQQYKNLPDWLKDAYWVTPPVNGVRYHMSKGYVGAALFGSTVERAINWMFDEAEDAGGSALKELQGMAGMLLERTLVPYMPSVVTPVLEQETNHNLFLNRPLVPDTQAKKDNWIQYTPATSQASKVIAGFLHSVHLDVGGQPLNVSPIILDNYIRQWGGTLPSQLWHSLGGIKDFNSQDIASWPIVGSFFVRRDKTGGKAVDDLYDRFSDVEHAVNGMKEALKTQDAAEIQRLAAGGMVRISEDGKVHDTLGINETKKALAQMRSFVNATNANAQLSDKEKLDITDQVLDSMVTVARAKVHQIDQLANRSQEPGAPAEPAPREFYPTLGIRG